MASDDVPVAINDDRDIEAEGLDAFGDFPDLRLGMTPWVGRVRFQPVAPTIDDA